MTDENLTTLDDRYNKETGPTRAGTSTCWNGFPGRKTRSSPCGPTWTPCAGLDGQVGAGTSCGRRENEPDQVLQPQGPLDPGHGPRGRRQWNIDPDVLVELSMKDIAAPTTRPAAPGLAEAAAAPPGHEEKEAIPRTAPRTDESPRRSEKARPGTGADPGRSHRRSAGLGRQVGISRHWALVPNAYFLRT